MNPYETLGVEADAAEDDINAAFKRRAKQTHPDTGGSAEEFAQVRLAYLVLSDAKRREQYDRTGTIDEDIADNAEQAALNMIGQMLAAFLAQDKEPFTDDLIVLMIRQLREHKAAIEKEIKAMDRVIARAERLKKKFTRKNDGENMLVRMIEWKAGHAEEARAAHRKQITDCDRAVEILKDYEFRRDRPDPATHHYSSLLSQLGGAAQSAGSWYNLGVR